MAEQKTAKVVILGDSDVGKTCILVRYIEGIFNEFQISTIGTNFVTKKITLNNKKTINIELWDTAGQERYRAVVQAFYHNVDVCIFVYDITNKNSFESIQNYWIPNVKKFNHINASKTFYNIFSFCFGWE